MEQIYDAAEGESFGGLLFPKSVKELDCLAMGEDVEEAQIFSIDAARGRQDGRKKCLVLHRMQNSHKCSCDEKQIALGLLGPYNGRTKMCTHRAGMPW